MGVVTFAQELESPIASDRLFKALMLDSHVLFPKLMPQYIKSIDLVNGDGGVGSVRQTNFAQESLLKYAKHRIDEMDAVNFRCKYTLIEGDILSDGLKSVVYEIEFVDDGNGGSICRMSSDYCLDRDIELRDEDIEAGKDRAMELYRAVEAYLLANPTACT
ncbi:major allergen Pru ar 1-like [Syzygium oleosum]|uniref:major allergen Pru ar 1-like n=1 Tax=Syzygium oleosum TaxID=219896 RepID=UPI0011D231EC|nr:major allergen Pru ar 1-like [Syzygium oleosum]